MNYPSPWRVWRLQFGFEDSNYRAAGRASRKPLPGGVRNGGARRGRLVLNMAPDREACQSRVSRSSADYRWSSVFEQLSRSESSEKYA